MLSVQARRFALVTFAGVTALSAVGVILTRIDPRAAHAGPEGSSAEARAAAEEKRRKRRSEIVEAVERAAPSVVSIGTTRVVPVRYFDWDFLAVRQTNKEERGLGSGVIVHPSGLVVTNAHVINSADQVVVRLTGVEKDAPEIPATILAADLDHDLALLRLEKPGPYPASAIGRSDDLMPGETVIAIGNPLGLGRTVTTGVVSALERSITIRDRTFEGLVQTDAAVNPGNSGGALLNILGEWIGVNSAIYSMSGGSDGVSFAIPMETVNRFLARNVLSGRALGRWIGCDLEETSPGEVRVTTVYPVGPAADAGLRRGVRVTSLDGRPAGSLGAATLALLDASVRGRVEFATEDPDGTRRAATVAFEEPPTERLAWERLGIRASEVTPAIRERTRYPVGSGILVEEVRSGGPAERVGLQPGDLLTALNERTLSLEEDLLDFVQRSPRGETAKVVLVRPERTRFGIQFDRWSAKLTLE